MPPTIIPTAGLDALDVEDGDGDKEGSAIGVKVVTEVLA
jgi:hypothetical protein